jgi:sugar lactone lactonase YvrE
MESPTATTRTLVDGLGFPEGPRWHAGRLWFSDFFDEVVRTVTLDGTVEQVLEPGDAPSGLGWTPDGDLLVVGMVSRQVLRVRNGRAEPFADLTPLTKVRANDMVVAPDGSAYVASFGFDLLAGDPPAPTVLVRVDPDGQVSVAAEDVWFPNGIVLTPDGRTLIFAETYGARLSAFTVEADGTLTDRRVFADLPGIAPDGICLDAEGQVWVATARTPEVVRVREGGEITARVAVSSGSRSYACMLGGDDGRTLFVCTAPGIHPSEETARSGRIEIATVEVPHAGLP